jgi:hypothetical protein
MAEDAGQPVRPSTPHIGEIKVEIDLTRARMSETLRAIDSRVSAWTHDDSAAIAETREREGGMVGLVAAGAIVAGRARTQLQRLQISPSVLAASAAGAIAVLVTLAGIRRRRRRARAADATAIKPLTL